MNTMFLFHYITLHCITPTHDEHTLVLYRLGEMVGPNMWSQTYWCMYRSVISLYSWGFLF